VSRRAAALAAVAAALACASLARATVVQEGNVRIAVLSQILPYKLPRHGTAPIAVFVSGHLSAPRGGIPSQLQEMTFEVNKHGLLQSRGLPTCPLARIQPASTQRALASFTGHNGKLHEFRTAVKPKCGGKAKKQKQKG